MGRLRWDSTLAFILAAVGSAAGLGNIWRFPYLAAKYGGGAFLFPYLIALFVVGVPLLMLEFTIGQRMQQGAIGSFENLHSKFGGLGVFALLSSLLLVAYYAVVIAWSLIYTVLSWQVPWEGDAAGYFTDEVLQRTADISSLGGINWTIFSALILVWILVYFSIWKGPKSVSKVVMWTVPLPVLFLLILLGKAVTLPGFLSGWALYLKPVWSALLDPEVWLQAIAQVFFTLSLAFGVMIAYSSYREEEADIARDTWITALANSAISLLSGFVVFGVLGYMAEQSGTALQEIATESGAGLAFVVFPKAIELMPLAGLFGFLFFAIILTLGIDSAFSLVEAVNAGVQDKTDRWHVSQVALIVGSLAFLIGIVFTTGAGAHILTVVDYFITTYNLVIIGLLEAVLVGWVYGAEKMRSVINDVSDMDVGRWWNYSVKYVIPLALVGLLGKNLYVDLTQQVLGGEYPAWAVGIGWAVVLVPFLYFLYYAVTAAPRSHVVDE